MLPLRLRTAAVLILYAGVFVATSASAAPGLTGPALVEALRGGGVNLYFRHAATDWTQADNVLEREDIRSCSPERMRQLSAQGRETARAVGEAMRALEVPVGRVLSSPYCRCVETAESLGVASVQPTTDIMNMRSANLFGGPEAVVARARRLFATPPEPGTVTVIVAHGNLMRAAASVSLGEAGAAVIMPDGAGGFEIVARLTPSDWKRLAVEYAKNP